MSATERLTRYFHSSDVKQSWFSRMKMANTLETSEKKAVELKRMTKATCHSVKCQVSLMGNYFP